MAVTDNLKPIVKRAVGEYMDGRYRYGMKPVIENPMDVNEMEVPDECKACKGTGWIESERIPGHRHRCEACGGDGCDHGSDTKV